MKIRTQTATSLQASTNTNFLARYNGTKLTLPQHHFEISITTDASPRGWGGVLESTSYRRTIQGVWNTEEQMLSSSEEDNTAHPSRSGNRQSGMRPVISPISKRSRLGTGSPGVQTNREAVGTHEAGHVCRDNQQQVSGLQFMEMGPRNDNDRCVSAGLGSTRGASLHVSSLADRKDPDLMVIRVRFQDS